MFFEYYAVWCFTSLGWYVFDGDRASCSVRASPECFAISMFSMFTTRSKLASISPNLLQL